MSGPFQMVGEPEFAAGLRYGLVALLLGLCIALAWRRWKGTSAPVAGLLLAVAVCVGLREAVGVPRAVVVSLVLLAAAATLGRAASLPRWMWLPVAAPAVWLLTTRGGLVEVAWIRMAVGVTTILGGLAVADFDQRWARSSAGPMLLAVSVVGVYFTVPDTEEALVLLGSSLPLVLLAWPLPLVRLGAGGAMVATALLTWVVATGGFGRQSSIVGGLACLGLLALEPATRMVRRHRWVEYIPTNLWAAPCLALVHLAFVTVASRVAGLREPVPARPDRPLARGGVAEAVVIVVAQAVAGLLLAVALHRSIARREREPEV